jgi:cupin fold WbuC family metalloprotein
MKVFSNELIDALAVKAAASERGRAHLTLHSGPQDLVQRFFVTARAGTYFRPHRHTAKSELAIVTRGALDVLTFDDAGIVTDRFAVGPGAPNIGFETQPGTWHTLVVRGAEATFIEVKQGPYDPATASEFAPWAPAEGSPEAAEFLGVLAGAQPGMTVSLGVLRSDAGQP